MNAVKNPDTAREPIEQLSAERLFYRAHEVSGVYRFH